MSRSSRRPPPEASERRSRSIVLYPASMPRDPEVSGGGQFHWNPETYLDEIRAEVPRYDELQAATIEAIPFAPKRVLELGVGTGETTRELLKRYPEARVTGLDASSDMVFRARELGIEVRLARMEDPLPDGPWDLVLSVLSVNQLDDDQRKNLCRQVKRQARSLVIGD